jgi:putative oxidoreductase
MGTASALAPCTRCCTDCGILIIFGLLTRLAAIPLIVVMLVAIASTKIPILLGHDWSIFHVPDMKRYGFWSMQHEARADFCMLLGAIYLLIVGGGGLSIDGWLSRFNKPKSAFV